MFLVINFVRLHIQLLHDIILPQRLANLLTCCFSALWIIIRSISSIIFCNLLVVILKVNLMVLIETPKQIISCTGSQTHLASFGRNPNFSKSACNYKPHIFARVNILVAPMRSCKMKAIVFACDRHNWTYGFNNLLKIYRVDVKPNSKFIVFGYAVLRRPCKHQVCLMVFKIIDVMVSRLTAIG